MTTKQKALKILPLTAAVGMALLSTSALAVDFFGYARGGIGAGSENGDQKTYKAAGSGAKYRLGNENDGYVEFGLGQDLFEQDGKTFRYELMLASGFNDGDNEWEQGEMAVVQNAAYADGVLGFAPEASMWAGKRYYNKHDVHMNDFFYVGSGGAGGGVEGINVGGDMELAVAWYRTTAGDQTSRETGLQAEEGVANGVLDARLAGIQITESTKLELIGMFATSNEIEGYDVDGVDNGQMYTAEFTTGLMGGFNKVVLQYATDSMALSGAGGRPFNNGGESGDLIRVINHGAIELSPSVEMMYNVMVDDLNMNNGEGRAWYSAGVRPQYQWNDNMATSIELGYDAVALDVTDYTNKVAKATVAQEWAPGGSIWSRPVVRAFATYAKWNDQVDTDGTSSAGFMGEAGSEVVVGAQFEAWW